jgi:O-antigen ligase
VLDDPTDEAPTKPAAVLAAQGMSAVTGYADIFFWCVLATYAAVLPIGGTPAVRNICLLVLAGLFAIGLWRRRVRFEFPLALPWAIYALVAAITLPYAIDAPYSLSEIRVEILYPLLVFLITANCLRSRSSLTRLLWILCSANLLMVAYSFVIAATGGTTQDGLIGTWHSGVGTFSTYIVTVLPLLCYFGLQQWRVGRHWLAVAIGLLVIANVIDIHITANRQGYVALMAELSIVAIWVFSRRFSWRLLAGIVVGAALLVALLASEQVLRNSTPELDALQVVKTDPRIELWRFTIDRIAERPWLGRGFGLRSFQKQFNYVGDNINLWHAHNMVLNKGIQMGIPGMLAFLVFYAAAPWRMREGFRGDDRVRALALAGLAMAVGVFVKNMTDDFFNREMAQLYWLLAGAVIGAISQAAAADG